uniref:Uncharacterized protein n=1 Tax=Rhizophora mucronata TaxID=61149 RepID=A0A2P2JLN4_RHIMU
MMMMTMMMWVY